MTAKELAAVLAAGLLAFLMAYLLLMAVFSVANDGCLTWL